MTGLLLSHLACQIAEQIKWHMVNFTYHKPLSLSPSLNLVSSLLNDLISPEEESNFYQTFIHCHDCTETHHYY